MNIRLKDMTRSQLRKIVRKLRKELKKAKPIMRTRGPLEVPRRAAYPGGDGSFQKILEKARQRFADELKDVPPAVLEDHGEPIDANQWQEALEKQQQITVKAMGKLFATADPVLEEFGGTRRTLTGNTVVNGMDFMPSECEGIPMAPTDDSVKSVLAAFRADMEQRKRNGILLAPAWDGQLIGAPVGAVAGAVFGSGGNLATTSTKEGKVELPVMKDPEDGERCKDPGVAIGVADSEGFFGISLTSNASNPVDLSPLVAGPGSATLTDEIGDFVSLTSNSTSPVDLSPISSQEEELEKAFKGRIRRKEGRGIGKDLKEMVCPPYFPPA